jgi:long-chain acyl-CoA synthetase
MSRLYDCIKRYNDTLPDNVSFTFREGESYAHISYRQLYEYLNTLSSYLAGYKGKSIAIIGNNKLEYAVCLLSVICNIGDAFLVDKELSEEDVVNVFSQKKPDLIILDDDLDFVFENYEVLKFSDVREVLKTRRDFDNDASFSGGLILHTSGTTGIPKCVRLDEQNYFGVIPELNRKWNVTSEQSCMLIIPLYHIYALVSLFHGLYAGINNILEYDYKRLNVLLKETRPCLFMGVPLMYNRIKDAIFEKSGKKVKTAIKVSNALRKIGIDVRKKVFKEIHEFFGGRYIFGCSAGSVLPYETNKFFNDVGLPVYNVYGMTETSGPIAINYKGHNDYKSVGEILDVNRVEIINKDSEGVGSVFVKGGNVFDGYIRDDKKDYFLDGYFDTGDIGYIKDNYLYVIGRKKNILIGDNGKNISPEEINKKILKNNKIHDCNVIMENNRLTAIVNTELSEMELKRYIDKVNDKLPKYKNIYKFKITDKKIK